MGEVHCWADAREIDAGALAATCLLPAEHDGPHEYTPDDDILVRIEPAAACQAEGVAE